MKNVAIRLDESKYTKLRVVVVQRGTSLQAAIEALIDGYLQTEDAKKTTPKDFRGLLRETNVIEDRARERKRELKRERSRT